MRVISVVNYKGGVGKTTFTANLGAELARRGKRVLLVDLDPQSSLTQCFYTTADYQQRIRPTKTIKVWLDGFVGGMPRSSLDAFKDTPSAVNAEIRKQREHQQAGQLDLIASDVLLFQLDLDAARASTAGDIDRELFLRRRALLDALSDRSFPSYDYVFLDCAPTFGLLTQAALVASRDIIMPAKADYLSTVGLNSLYSAIYQFRQDYANQAARYGGRHAGGASDPGDYVVVYTMVEFMRQRPAPSHQFYMDQVEREYKIPSFKIVMRQSAATYGSAGRYVVPPVLQLKARDQIREELKELASEFMTKFDAKHDGLGATWAA